MLWTRPQRPPLEARFADAARQRKAASAALLRARRAAPPLVVTTESAARGFDAKGVDLVVLLALPKTVGPTRARVGVPPRGRG